jgi:hypothetical protein
MALRNSFRDTLSEHDFYFWCVTCQPTSRDVCTGCIHEQHTHVLQACHMLNVACSSVSGC